MSGAQVIPRHHSSPTAVSPCLGSRLSPLCKDNWSLHAQTSVVVHYCSATRSLARHDPLTASPEVPGWDLDAVVEPRIGDIDVQRLAPEPVFSPLIWLAPSSTAIGSPVRFPGPTGECHDLWDWKEWMIWSCSFTILISRASLGPTWAASSCRAPCTGPTLGRELLLYSRRW